MLLLDLNRKAAIEIICSNHYSHSVPSGKSYYFEFESALVVFSIPANKNIGGFLLGFNCCTWELSRLWAPNGHEKNLLTKAISKTVKAFLKIEPNCDILVSYADPNIGHSGGVYKAASWVYHGQSEESRYYVNQQGQVFSRRAFHSGRKSMTKKEILNLGFEQLKKPGKYRFIKPISKKAKKIIKQKEQQQ